MADVFRALEKDGIARFQSSWHELQADVDEALATHRS
jgi:hypothetical protein